MRRYSFIFTALLCLSIGAAAVLAAGKAPVKKPATTPQKPPENDETRAEGKKVYEMYCLSCHGEKGQGDGKGATFTYPKPRDFSKGLFKIRTTPSGSLPTDGDMFWTITRGMNGSAMPSFKGLSERERWTVIYYIKTFIEAYQYRKPEPPISVPPAPPVTAQSIALGKRMYQKMECYKCHGPKGMGDGPSAEDQTDDWGFPVRVRDFTDGVYKGGPNDSDLYLRFTTGMTGSPMPAYAGDKMTTKERWGLVHFVQSLKCQDRPVITPPANDTIVAAKASGEIPADDPGANVWNQATVYQVPLNPLFQRVRNAPNVSHVRVRALYNDSQIAVLLEWDDKSMNSEMLKARDFRDAASVQFATSGDKLTFVGMGHKDLPSNLWHWKADWQVDMDGGADINKRFPNMHVDMYQYADANGEQEELFMTGRAAGNAFSRFGRKSPIEDLNAIGFGSLTPQENEQQNVQGKGIWTGKAWRVLFVRSLNSSDNSDVKFSADQLTPLAFAIWDGSQGDRDGQKLVSTWYRLKLK
jgi:DMSO reductase family type II enzyme heme b subunit